LGKKQRQSYNLWLFGMALKKQRQSYNLWLFGMALKKQRQSRGFKPRLDHLFGRYSIKQMGL
jgi:hypothetical protein